MPLNLESVDPRARTFPTSWRDAAIRALYDESVNGVVCPNCNSVFRRLKQLRMLHGDHIIPYSLGGPTTWENLQLLCQGCNLAKYNRVLGGEKEQAELTIVSNGLASR